MINKYLQKDQYCQPLHRLNPVTVTAKLIMQQLWQLGLSWDESVEGNIYTNWIKFVNNLDILNTIEIWIGETVLLHHTL